MRDHIACSVYALIDRGLEVRDRLDAGEPLDLEAEQVTLLEMLAPLETEEVWDADESQAFDFSEKMNGDGRGRLSQATIRRALVCWLDELFLFYSPWAERWAGRTLESILDRTNGRAGAFWEEARYAEVRGDLESLEVLFLCVILGFRGDWRDQSVQLEAWISRVRTLLATSTDQPEVLPLEWAPLVRDATPGSDLPFRRMVFTGMLTGSVFTAAALLMYWRQWTS